jgi:hypothetical protein
MVQHNPTTASTPRRISLPLIGIPAISTLMSTYIGSISDIRWVLAFGILSAISQFWIDIQRFRDSANRATP